MGTPRLRPLIFALLSVLGLALIVVPVGPAVSEGAAPAGPEAKEATVELVAFQAKPDRIEITTGTTVTWINKEPADYPVKSGQHEIKADDGSWASPSLAPGTRWSHRFAKPGTFTYHCVHHPDLTGQLVVTGEAVAEPVEKEVGITEEKPDDPTSWGFVPNDLILEVGSTVVWRNNGTNTHTVTANDKSFGSPDIKPGETFRHSFDTPGAFAYHCTPHPWMKGLIRIVVPGGPPPEAPPPMAHEAGTGVPMGEDAATPARTGPGPARLDVKVIETDPANPNSWRFSPTTLELRTGDTVVWHNTGSVAHSVTSDTGLFDSGLIQPGHTFERTFTDVGVFAYHCTPHPWMKALVRVSEPGKEAPALPDLTATRTSASAGSTAPAVVQRTGSGPVTVALNIVEPDISDAMGWGFAPKVVDVKVGDTVVWKNTGTLQHSVTADGGAFDAGLVNPGASFTRTFDSTGVYAYHCTPHPWMKGVVRVTSADGSAPPPLPKLTRRRRSR